MSARAVRRAMASLACLAGVCGASPLAPFSGSFGGTAGAGATLGWDRPAAGANPAALEAPGTRAALAGYSPYGLAGWRVLELGLARDGAGWSAAWVHQGVYEEAGMLSSWNELQLARRGADWSVGVSGAHRWASGAHGIAGGAGALWKPSWGAWNAGFGAQARAESGEGLEIASGAEIGSGIPRGPGWRLCGEALASGDGETEARVGAGLRLHALLSAHAGWAWHRRTVALGLRFGAGNWEGFSAVRRHAVLGGTAVQGLRWRRAAARERE